MMRVREATVGDAAGVLAVYAPYIRDTAITFETAVPSVAEFAARMGAVIGDYPYLVMEEAGAIAGFAYAHRLGERAAYVWNAELSVYLAPACTGRGWGSALMKAVIELLALQGVRNVYSLVTVPNEPSRRAHGKLGFEVMGVQRRAGFKQGAWHDVAWLHRALGPFAGEPAPRVPLGEVDGAAVRAILAAAEAAVNGAAR